MRPNIIFVLLDGARYDRIHKSPEFVELMKHPKSTGGYYYSPNCDRFSFPILCSTVFATKVFYMLNNDINDKDVMTISGITFSPSDAHPSIKSISDYVLKSKGGDGVVREILDHILQEKET